MRPVIMEQSGGGRVSASFVGNLLASSHHCENRKVDLHVNRVNVILRVYNTDLPSHSRGKIKKKSLNPLTMSM